MNGFDYLGADEAAPSLDAVRTGDAVIKRGMRGPAVEYVQKVVDAEMNGVFDEQTETAVKSFQSACGLTDDGVVGKETLGMLDEAFKGTTYTIVETVADKPAPVTQPTPQEPQEASSLGWWIAMLLAGLATCGAVYARK